jgi:hypothetical protein
MLLFQTSGIVYARTRAACTWVADQLQDRGVEATAYHAGIDGTVRRRALADWQEAKDQVSKPRVYWVLVDDGDYDNPVWPTWAVGALYWGAAHIHIDEVCFHKARVRVLQGFAGFCRVLQGFAGF